MDDRPIDPAGAAARSITDEWGRVLTHLPRDVFEALPDDVMFASVPDPGADDGVHASFAFDEGRTLVSYRDEHAVVATRREDGSVLIVAYHDGAEDSRHTVPAAAISPDIDPSSN